MAQIINSKTEWLNSIEVGTQETGQFSGRKELGSLATTIWKWNKTEGRDRGIVITATYNYDEITATVTASAR